MTPSISILVMVMTLSRAGELLLPASQNVGHINTGNGKDTIIAKGFWQ
jgi:hypothetical protein